MTIIDPKNRYTASYQIPERSPNSSSKIFDTTIMVALETEILFGKFEQIDSRLGAAVTAFGKIIIPIDNFPIGQNLLVLKTSENFITILTIPDQNITQSEITEIVETQDYGRYGDFMQISTSTQSLSQEINARGSHLVISVSEIMNNTLNTERINNLTSLDSPDALTHLISLANTIYCSNTNGANQEETNLLSHLRSIASATASLNWQIFLIPYYDDGKIEFIKAFKRRNINNSTLDFENFIFEGSNSELGRFSLNILYSRKLSIFELLLKHSSNNNQKLVEEIKKSFLETAYYFNMQSKFFVKEDDKQNDSGMLGDILQEYCKNKAFTVLA